MKNTLLALLMFSMFSVFGQGANGIITGALVDAETSEPIPFATIRLEQSNSDVVLGTTSDFDGKFKLEQLALGDYQVVISFLGYASHSLKIEIAANDSKLDLGIIQLNQKNEALSEVQVTASKRAVVTKIDRKSYKVSEFETARGGTATDVLNKLPSVSVNPDGQISVRGTEDFIVYLNGKPTQMDPVMLLGQISSDAMVSVDVITVPTSKFDAQGKGGIINITTKTAGVEGFSLSLNGTIGGSPWGNSEDVYSGYKMNDNRYNTGVNLMYGTGKLLLRGGFTISDKNVNGARTGDARILDENTGAYKHMVASGERPEWYESYAANAGFDYQVSENSSFSASYMYGNRTEGRSAFYIYNNFYGDKDKNAIAGVPVNEEWVYNPNTDNRYGIFQTLNFDFVHKFDAGKELSTSFSYENSKLSRELDNYNYDYDPISDTVGDVSLHFNQTDETPLDGYRLAIDYTTAYDNGNTLGFGFQPYFFNIDGTFNYDDLAGSVDDLENGIDLSRGVYAGYVDYSGSYNNFSYIAGLRLEYTDQIMEIDNPDYFTIFNTPTESTFKVQQLDWFPTVHADYKFGETSKMNFAASRRISRPPVKNMAPFLYRRHLEVYVVGDPNLEPEYINAVELGYDKKFGKQRINLTGFYRGVDNAIFRVNTIYEEELVLIRSYTNAGNTKALGIELNANFDFGKVGNLFLGGSLYDYSVKGDIFGYKEDNSSTNWSLKGNANFNLSKAFKFSTDFDMKSATVTAQGQNDMFYMMNVALNYTPKNNKNINFNLKGLDILGSNETGLDTQAFNSNSQEIFYQETSYLRVGPIVEFGLTYNFNKRTGKKKSQTKDFGAAEF